MNETTTPGSLEGAVLAEPTQPDTILIVDDSEVNRRLAASLLTPEGFAILQAPHGEAGIAMVEERVPDLVLLDVMMPGIDGFETCRRLRALPVGRDLPVLFVTAIGDLDAYERAVAVGADDLIAKPFTRSELILRVRSLLRIRRLGAELRRNLDLVMRQHDELSHLQRRKDDLVALIVHDLKAPIAGALVNAEFVADREKLEEPSKGALADVIEGIKALDRSVMNLLDVSRADEGKLDPRCREIEVRTLLDSVVGATSMRARSRYQELVVEDDDAPNVAWIDADLIERVVINLVDNALKYAPSRSRVRLIAKPDNDGIELSVIDRGAGIPEDWRERIFDRWARMEAEPPVSRRSRGLGLTFCKLAVEAHGGTIDVRDAPEGGAWFRVWLPIRRPAR